MLLCLDIESWPIAPRRMAPRPATIQLCGDPGDAGSLAELLGVELDHLALERPSSVVPGAREIVATASSRAFGRLRDAAHDGALAGRWTIVCARPAFDLLALAEWHEDRRAALARVFALLDAGAVSDVADRQRLIDIARGSFTPHGGYDLGSLAAVYGAVADKESPWRLRFSELVDVPIGAWPREALEYALGDASAPLVVRAGQDRVAADLSERLGSPVLHDEPARVRAAAALHLIHAHGIHTDPEVVELYAEGVRLRVEEAREVLRAEGLAALERDGKWHRRDKLMRERLIAEWGRRGRVGPQSPKNPGGWPTTESGRTPAADASVASAFEGDSFHPVIRAWADYTSARSASDRVAEVLAGAGDDPIHTSYGLVETGRSNSFGPNVQNRKVDGLDRSCFAPRPARRPGGTGVGAEVLRTCYLDTDHDGLELATLAQVLIALVGWSRLAEALVAGRDPHLEVGARLLGTSFEEIRARYKAGDRAAYLARQSGKIANFGFAGGCGVPTFIRQTLAKYGILLTVEEATRIRSAWLESWPEMREYFRIMSHATRDGTATLRQLYSCRWRGGLIYTEACNTMFQSLGADLTAAVLYELQRACYVTESSPLYGCRVENYVHDQYLLAIPRDGWEHERAEAKRAIVEGVARAWLPDLRPTATPMACARWSKSAREVRDETGRLRVWEYDPLIEAAWSIGGRPSERRTSDAEALGALGRDALDLVEGLEARARAAGADPGRARRALDARMCESATGYARGPSVGQARLMIEDAVAGALAA